VRQKRLGDSDLTVPVVGLGCNNFAFRMDDAQVTPTVHAALDHGVTLFDTANSYGGRGGSERLLGEALEGRRDEAIIATKFGWDMGDNHENRGSAPYVRKALEDSLSRLRTDRIDLYQMHVPDPNTPIEETLGALTDLVVEGRIRYLGCSNFEAWRLVDADWTSRTNSLERFVSVQNQYSLIDREIEREVVPVAAKLGVGILPFFPLANGVLTGKYLPGGEVPSTSRLGRNPQRAEELLTPRNFEQLHKLDDFARECGRSLLDVALAGLAVQPQVGCVIAGATSPDQVRMNAEAGDWELDADEVAALRAILDSIDGASE
jgi:aryl-alcohol dehydrogenase-like predicted oxidoreductase